MRPGVDLKSAAGKNFFATRFQITGPRHILTAVHNHCNQRHQKLQGRELGLIKPCKERIEWRDRPIKLVMIGPRSIITAITTLFHNSGVAVKLRQTCNLYGPHHDPRILRQGNH